MIARVPSCLSAFVTAAAACRGLPTRRGRRRNSGRSGTSGGAGTSGAAGAGGWRGQRRRRRREPAPRAAAAAARRVGGGAGTAAPRERRALRAARRAAPEMAGRGGAAPGDDRRRRNRRTGREQRRRRRPGGTTGTGGTGGARLHDAAADRGELLRRRDRRHLHAEPGPDAGAGLQGRHHPRRVHERARRFPSKTSLSVSATWGTPSFCVTEAAGVLTITTVTHEGEGHREHGPRQLHGSERQRARLGVQQEPHRGDRRGRRHQHGRRRVQLADQRSAVRSRPAPGRRDQPQGDRRCACSTRTPRSRSRSWSPTRATGSSGTTIRSRTSPATSAATPGTASASEAGDHGRLLLLLRPQHRPGDRELPDRHRRGADVSQMGLRPLPVEGPLSELGRADRRSERLSQQQHPGRRHRSGLAVLEPCRVGLAPHGRGPVSRSRPRS